jgi:hypothetical protein
MVFLLTEHVKAHTHIYIYIYIQIHFEVTLGGVIKIYSNNIN